MSDPLQACPVCGTLTKPSERHPTKRIFTLQCCRCGVFSLTPPALESLSQYFGKNKRQMALSYAIRRIQEERQSEPPLFTHEQVESLAKTGYLPTPKEQADNLIRWLGDTLAGPGELITVNPDDHGGIVGSASDLGFIFVVNGLKAGDLIISQPAPFRRAETFHNGLASSVTLTFKGWERYEELKSGAASGSTAFMALKFGDPELDEFLENHLREAVRKTGFTLRRLDDEPRAGLIDDRLRVEIKACRFLIADLTHGNKGAYWEAGYAEGLGKPVIYTCKREVFENIEHPDRPHFDTNHHLTVVWDSADLQGAVERLQATIRATLPDARREVV